MESLKVKYEAACNATRRLKEDLDIFRKSDQSSFTKNIIGSFEIRLYNLLNFQWIHRGNLSKNI